MRKNPYKNSNVPGQISDLLGLSLNPMLQQQVDNYTIPTAIGSSNLYTEPNFKAPTSIATRAAVSPMGVPKTPDFTSTRKDFSKPPITPKTIETLSAPKVTPKKGVDMDFAKSGKGLLASGAIQGAGAILDSFDNDEEVYTEKGEAIEEGVATAIGTVAPMFGPVGMAVGAAATLGQKVEDLAKDTNGTYKGKGAEIADQVLNPIGRTSDLIRNISSKDLSVKEKASSALNYGTYGLLGKNAQQGIAVEVADKRRKKKGRATIAKQAQNSIVAGNVQPKYTARAYGQ